MTNYEVPDLKDCEKKPYKKRKKKKGQSKKAKRESKSLPPFFSTTAHIK